MFNRHYSTRPHTQITKKWHMFRHGKHGNNTHSSLSSCAIRGPQSTLHVIPERGGVTVRPAKATQSMRSQLEAKASFVLGTTVCSPGTLSDQGPKHANGGFHSMRRHARVPFAWGCALADTPSTLIGCAMLLSAAAPLRAAPAVLSELCHCPSSGLWPCSAIVPSLGPTGGEVASTRAPARRPNAAGGRMWCREWLPGRGL